MHISTHTLPCSFAHVHVSHLAPMCLIHYAVEKVLSGQTCPMLLAVFTVWAVKRILSLIQCATAG